MGRCVDPTASYYHKLTYHDTVCCGYVDCKCGQLPGSTPFYQSFIYESLSSLRKIPDLHFVDEHDFMTYPPVPGPLTLRSIALRRSCSFAFFRAVLKEALIDIDDFVRIESAIIGSGWQESTLRATFLDDYPTFELGDRRCAYCKYCKYESGTTRRHETPWEQRVERGKEMKDPNGPFSDKELRQQDEWQRYVHVFVGEQICGVCRERTRLQNDTEDEDGFSPYLMHL